MTPNDKHNQLADWNELGFLVVDSLEKLDAKTDNLDSKIDVRFNKIDEKLDKVVKDLWTDVNKLDRKIAVLETKAFMLGLLGGAILSIVLRVLKIT